MDENPLSDVSRDIWRRVLATSRLKENTTLDEVLDTCDSANEFWYVWATKHTNHKMKTKSSNISENSFFRYAVSLHIRLPVMIRVWRMTHEQNMQRDKVECAPSPSFEFQIQIYSWRSWIFVMVVFTSSALWYDKFFVVPQFSIFKTWKRRWRKTDHGVLSLKLTDINFELDIDFEDHNTNLYLPWDSYRVSPFDQRADFQSSLRLRQYLYLLREMSSEAWTLSMINDHDEHRILESNSESWRKHEIEVLGNLTL